MRLTGTAINIAVAIISIHAIDLQYKLTTNSRVKMTTNKISIALSF